MQRLLLPTFLHRIRATSAVFSFVLLGCWDCRRAFSALCDDCPLPPGELSSSLVTALCHTPHVSPEQRHPPTETEPGLLMLTTADSPGLEVKPKNRLSPQHSRWSPICLWQHLYCCTHTHTIPFIVSCERRSAGATGNGSNATREWGLATWCCW